MRLRNRIRRWWSGEAEPIQLVVADWSFTGEQPIVERDVQAWHWEPVLEHEQPIGPEPATAAELFAADPLGAPLPDVLRVNPSYAHVLKGQSTWMSPDVLANLEGPTGYWRADDFKKIAERGRR